MKLPPREIFFMCMILTCTMLFGAMGYYQGYSEGINDGYHACMMSHGK